MATLEVSPVVTADDGLRPSFSPNGNPVIGTDGTPRNSWFRFPGVTIPQGSTIDVAYLVINESAAAAGAVLSNLFGIDEDNHVAPINDAGWVTDHALHTSASVAWDFTAANTNADRQSPSIVSIIQEIVDRPGWVSGNAIGIHQDDDGTTSTFRQIWDDVEDANPAVLHIEYTEIAVEPEFDSEEGGEVNTAIDLTSRAEPVFVLVGPTG